MDHRRDGLWVAYRLADNPESPLHATMLALVRIQPRERRTTCVAPHPPSPGEASENAATRG
ncbi:MAG: hypothetical protein H6Q81_1376 [Deltaproteobacteria bacterium]|nr:hypothetical protein [Deltaproteobacteria bacterium]